MNRTAPAVALWQAVKDGRVQVVVSNGGAISVTPSKP